MTILPTDRTPFAERAVLKLLELSKAYEGVKALRQLERARRFRSLFGSYRDVSSTALEGLNRLAEDRLEDSLVDLFWHEMGRQVVLPEALARLTLGLPEATKPNASCCFELGASRAKPEGRFKRVDLSYLKMAPFEVRGTTPNFADDVAIFDLRATDGLPNPLDLRPYSPFITAGTTISFYYPAAQHEEWFIFARPFRMPPEFMLDKRLAVIFAKPVSPDVNCVVYGVETAGTLSQTP